MNRNQIVMLAVAAANLIVIALFPPFDIHSIARAGVTVFGGFNFIFSRNQYMLINSGVLFLEVFVVLINAGIGWLLLQTRKSAVNRRRVGLQNATLIMVAVNLVVIMLFPPFESAFTLTKAAIPNFEGFYFIFAPHPDHVIVTAILYLEVCLVLINGALFWLIFREKKPDALTPEEMYELMREIKKSSDK